MERRKTEEEEDGEESIQLTGFQKFCFGVGHVQNDLCASMWFSYMLLFMHKVVSLNNVDAGLVVLIGQIADGLATPFVGIQSDETSHGRYGRRKKWHLFGVICVSLSFPFLFNMCIHKCANAEPYALMIYYIPFIVIFQFGWASTQISHLALIPEITHCGSAKVELNAIRYFFTVLSNIVVFVVCFGLFATGSSTRNVLTRMDAPKFKILGIGVVVLGLIFMLIFHLGVKERCIDDFTVQKKFEESADFRENNKTVRMWFKTPLFYQVGALYMFTRLIVNISQIYISYFVLDSLELDKNAIAIAPAVIYVSGILASLIAKKLNAKLGLKWTYFFGLCLICGSSTWFFLLETLPSNKRSMVYGACILLGMGGSTLLINSLAMISELIGKNTGTAAFVFGAMSFLDKVSNGSGVMIIQYLHPCQSDIFCRHACKEFYRYIMSFVPSACAVLAFCFLLSLPRSKFGKQTRTAAAVVEVECEPEDVTQDLTNHYPIQIASD